jgi:hypothetical protein
MFFCCSCEFLGLSGVGLGIGIRERGYHPVLCESEERGQRLPERGIIEEVERRRGLAKRSTCFESLIRRALDPEGDAYVRGKGMGRRIRC